MKTKQRVTVMSFNSHNLPIFSDVLVRTWRDHIEVQDDVMVELMTVESEFARLFGRAPDEWDRKVGLADSVFLAEMLGMEVA